MIVKGYKLTFDIAGVASLWVVTSNGTEVHICNIDGLSGLGSDQVEERVFAELSSRGIEVKDELDAGNGALSGAINGSDVSISSDLAGIRSCMRKALKNLDSSTSTHKKKDMIPVYDSMCKVSQVLINACKAEMVSAASCGGAEKK